MSISLRLRKLLPMGLSYIASGGSLMVSSLAQLLTFAILARSLGVEEFSVFIALTAITAVAVHLCGLGGSEPLVRRVARNRTLYASFLGHNLLLGGASGVAMIAVGMLVLPGIYQLSADLWVNLGLILMVLVTNIVLTRVILFVEQVFIAHSNFAAANRNVILFALGRLAAAVLACMVFGVDTLADWIVWAFAAHVVIAAIAVRSVLFLGPPEWVVRREELRNGLLFTTPFILRALRQNVDLLLLAALANPEVVASYAVARRIIDSAYLSVEALNRLVYPGSAAATKEGLHHALGRFRKVFGASMGISVLTVVGIIVTAPILPWLFGAEYVSLPGYTQLLAPSIIFIAGWATAVEALGASGHHLPRAIVFNGGVALGGVVIALATWFYGINGTFVATYASELGTALAGWLVLLRLAEKDRRAAISSDLATVPSK
ncbi:MAG: lipopolysaccharide biosynthesis protein [Devosia sp.]|uniref:lipopolysaccharide biosynthesis protein n=1 Tax=unclassified Devosia TaxID=196773 RepID=UPI0019D8067A|nr:MULTISPECIES: lipopolysaccharide biosynthesis protein [unclassified Devosia]MBF0679008.1 lipopolysaccharide biosynthesis protein [Devosia sp.]WEJ33622.1 lipopolysaccharide biosynthesis protein [Devosia sp. SD17-2]